MNDEHDTGRLAARALADLIAQFGPALADEPGRLGSLLRDECPTAKREINVLLDALAEHVVADLRASAGTPLAVTQSKLAERLVRDRGMRLELARWGVETWSHALGLGEIGAAGTAAPAPAPSPSPSPAPTPTPTPSPLDRLRAFFLDATGRPRLARVAIAIAAAALIAWQFAGSPQGLSAIDVAGTTFKGPSDALAEVIGDGRTHRRAFVFAPRTDGERVAIEMRWTDGSRFGNGTDRRVVPVPPEAARAGRFEETFNFEGTQAARRGEATLLVNDAPIGKPIPFAYRAVAVPGTNAPRITGVTYPKTFPAGEQWQDFRVAFEDPDGDVARIDIQVRQGSWKAERFNLSGTAGMKSGTVTHRFRSTRAERGVIELRLIDARGNFSAPFTVDFETVDARGGTPAAATNEFKLTRYSVEPFTASGDTVTVPVKVFYEGGDAVRFSWSRRGDGTVAGTETFPAAKPGERFVSATVRITIPNRPGTVGFDLVATDAQGRNSNRLAVDLSVTQR